MVAGHAQKETHVPDTTGTWLTQEAYDRLQQEYDFLAGEGRAAIATEIDERRQEGDLKENGGYHAAREEQAKQEARIARLRQILRDATVGEAPADDGIVEPGMLVVANVAGREMKFLVGSRESADGTDLDVFSTQSPLGAALLGKKIGDETSYTAPNGNDITVKVIAAEPFTG
ncbi:transcription elongation factor GreA [Demequina aurantiaca]|uniref:transcription elongation factor GreA n=1 Tax=Demequina aurantiaca TaxID=676200 RepID=UPI003D336FA7